jgi:hypothetical protein
MPRTRKCFPLRADFLQGRRAVFFLTLSFGCSDLAFFSMAGLMAGIHDKDDCEFHFVKGPEQDVICVGLQSIFLR